MTSLHERTASRLHLINHSLSPEKVKAITDSVVLEAELIRFRQRFRCRYSLSFAITPTNHGRVQQFVRTTLKLVLIIRMDVLLTNNNQGDLEECQHRLRDQYVKLMFGYSHTSHLAFSILTVVAGCIITNVLRTLFPELQIDERLKMDIVHLIIKITLGVFVGDSAIRTLISKFVEERAIKQMQIESPQDHIQLSRIVSRYSNDWSNNEPTSELAESWLREIKEFLRVEPVKLPVLLPKKIEDQTDFQSESTNLDNTNIQRRLKGYKMYSSQLSASMADVRCSQQNFLPYVRPVKLSVHLECTSLHYNRKKKEKKMEPYQQVAPPPKKEQVKKDTLTYWRSRLQKLKALNMPDAATDQTKDAQTTSEEEDIDASPSPRIQTEPTTADTKCANRNQTNNILTEKPKEALLKNTVPVNTEDKKPNQQNYKLASLMPLQNVSLNEQTVQRMVYIENVLPKKRKYRYFKAKQLRRSKQEFERNCLVNILDLEETEWPPQTPP